MSSSPNSKPETPGGAEQSPVKRASLIKRCILVTAAFLITLVTLSSLLLFTHTGNTLLWRQLSNSLPALDGELTEGQLMTGWNIKNFQWQDSQITFLADEITLKWQLAKLLTRQLPVQLLEVKGGNLEIQPAAEETKPSAPSTADTTINIPLDILINQIPYPEF